MLTGRGKEGIRPLPLLLPLALLFLLAAGAAPGKKTGPTKKSGTARKVEPPAEKAEISWLLYEDALRKGKLENKNIFVDFYTDWCGWCKRLDKDVYSDSGVKALLSKHFVNVKVNAESRRSFKLDDGAEFSEASLARDVYQVQGYPALWFLTSEGEKLTYIPGYVPKDKFINILNFIRTKAYLTKKFEEFEKEQTGKKGS